VRPPVPRFVRWTVALSVLAALTLAVFQYWGSSQYGTVAARSGQSTEWTQTRWGPLSPADRDLLVMVRQAGLSGGPTGQQAQRQGSNPQVRTVAKRIWLDYSDLDNQVRSVAGKLGVSLPEQPTAAQQGWMKELSGQAGQQYDRMFAQRLRLTDGEVLPALTTVRADTRNELIRSFAASAATLISNHMEALERTGMIDYSRLPAPRPPAATPPAASAAAGADQRVGQVVSITPVSPAGSATSATGNDANALIAALVSIGALLVALGLLGTGRRVARKPATAQRHRRAAHRW
jgi:predicted outer membrane protein